MSETARVDSIDAIKAFKASLVKFAEVANVALASAEGDLRRTLLWLQTDQLSHWQTQVRIRHEALTRAKDAVRQKMLFKDSTGRTPTPVDEWKAQKIAQRKLDVAEDKLGLTRRAIRVLEKSEQNYKGSVQRFATMVQSDIPRALERLDRAYGHLETYVTLAEGSGVRGQGSGNADTQSERDLASSSFLNPETRTLNPDPAASMARPEQPDDDETEEPHP